MNAIAWTVQQMGRTDLPGREPNHSTDTPKTRAAREAFDRTWRTRQEICRMVGCAESTLQLVLSSMKDELEVLPGKGGKPSQYRRRG